MFFKKKMKNYSTAFIMFIYIITILLPSKLVLAAEIAVPVMTLVGDDTVYVATGSIYEDPGVDIKDDKDTNLSANVTVTDGDVTVVTTRSAVTYEKGAYMVFDKEGTYELQYNVTDSDKNVAAKVTRTVEVNTMDDESIDDDYNVGGYETDLGFKLLSDSEIEDLLEGAITTPAAVTVTRDDDTLTAKLMKEDGKVFTTSAAVEYEWYSDNELVEDETDDTYAISDDDIGNSIVVKAKFDDYEFESEPFYIEKDGSEVTTPAAVSVRIKGTEKVGNTLTGEFILEDGNEVTTPSAVTYEWYRLSSKDSENDELVGDSKTYKLVSSDKNKYIKLLINYENEIYEAITSKIAGKSSSSSSRSSSSSSSSNSTNNETTTNEQTDTTNNQADTTNNNPTTSVKGWSQIGGSWYLKDLNGNVLTGWQQTNGTWYLLNSDGAMVTGWQQTNGTWYLLNSDGAMATGWQQTNGTWYLLNSDGAMATGWQQVNGTWYLLNSTGAMATGWHQVDGTWYFLNSDGALAE